MIAKEAWEDARAGAVEAIKAHLTDRYVDHDAEEIAWNVLDIIADMWDEQEAADRAETTTDEACGDYPAPCNCDDPATHDGATTETTTAVDAVGELLEWMSNAVTQLEALRDEHWDASERQRLLGKVEGVKLAASYVEEARDLLATSRTATIEDAARVLVRETTSGLCEYGRVCDECDCFADAGGRERDAYALALARAMDREGLLATTRTRPTREQIDHAVGEVLSNASNHPDPVAVLGRSIAPLRNKITDAVLELLQDSAR